MVLADLGKRITSAVSNLTHSNVVDEKASTSDAAMSGDLALTPRRPSMA